MFGLFRNLLVDRKTGPERRRRLRRPLHLEALEDRCVPAAVMSGGTGGVTGGGQGGVGGLIEQPTAAGLALINSLSTPQVRTTALADYQRDAYISRNDMLGIFSAARSTYGYVAAGAFTDLGTLAGNGPTVGMPGSVQYLALTSLHSANAELQASIQANRRDGVTESATLENIDRGSFLAGEVDNWFLGAVHPDDTYTYSNGDSTNWAYYPVSVPLWTGTPVYKDVFQNTVADCWLMASLAEVALRDPSYIQNMITDNGDNTYTVRFFNGGTPEYVTVDNYLPGGGRHAYAWTTATSMWPALIEKAYVQANAAGMVMSHHQGQDSYQALDYGYASWALSAITGLSATDSSSIDANSIANDWSAGKFLVLCTTGSPANSALAPTHCYAVLNDQGGEVTLFNPWGINGGTDAANGNFYAGTVIEAGSDLTSDFAWWTPAGAAGALTGSQALTISAFSGMDAQAASGAQTPIQVGFHQESTSAAPADTTDQAMLTSLARVRGGSTSGTLSTIMKGIGDASDGIAQNLK
jgi:hypothetical protein